MERLKAGFDKLKGATDKVNLVSAVDALGAVPGMNKLIHARQFSINGRTVVEDRQISEGGFAYVWLVHDVRTNQELVLKKILCQDSTSLAMARREIAILERLPQHPNLVRYFGSTILAEGKKSHEAALLFEVCSGGHLLNLLEKHQGQLGENRIVETLSEVVAGVAVLHEMSPPIQHRDLKVENVLLGADGHWKLLDFGSWSDERSEPGKLDKHALAALQEHIEKYTTMMYRPPEMVDLHKDFMISEKVDIWMLGCILYTLMYYRHPFQDESTLAIANARYQLPASPEFSEKLKDLTHWLLAKDPSDRPSARELLEILRNFGDGSTLLLPKSVIERRDHFKRLYEGRGKTVKPEPVAAVRDGRDSAPVSPMGDGDRPRKSKHRPHGKAHKESKASKRKEQSDSVWGQAELSNADAWPSASTIPEPSTTWADFAAFGERQQQEPPASATNSQQAMPQTQQQFLAPQWQPLPADNSNQQPAQCQQQAQQLWQQSPMRRQQPVAESFEQSRLQLLQQGQPEQQSTVNQQSTSQSNLQSQLQAEKAHSLHPADPNQNRQKQVQEQKRFQTDQQQQQFAAAEESSSAFAKVVFDPGLMPSASADPWAGWNVTPSTGSKAPKTPKSKSPKRDKLLDAWQETDSLLGIQRSGRVDSNVPTEQQKSQPASAGSCGSINPAATLISGQDSASNVFWSLAPEPVDTGQGTVKDPFEQQVFAGGKTPWLAPANEACAGAGWLPSTSTPAAVDTQPGIDNGQWATWARASPREAPTLSTAQGSPRCLQTAAAVATAESARPALASAVWPPQQNQSPWPAQAITGVVAPASGGFGDEDPWKEVMKASPSPASSPKAAGNFGQPNQPASFPWAAFD
eukprot:TRINITY_DN40692_c0_g1_i1.p1 TRINITY_DN40692_c0_g1~~TRINITY_DN40692_c0_g1_i1.p1  ORF type:complete len:862 (+),score=172.89 TRINITY_DN40692_c0_g1_i1:49-2634(+)